MKVMYYSQKNTQTSFSLRHIVLFLLVLISCGCISIPPNNQVKIAPDAIFILTAPPKLLWSTTQSHLIEAVFEQKTHRFIAQVEYSPAKIALAAISVSGVPLFDFIWREGEEIKVNQYIPLPGIDINNVIADIQWINWPISKLKSSLLGEYLKVTEVINENGWQRLLKQNNQIILSVKKDTNDYMLDNKLRNYQIKITDLTKGES